MNKKPKTAPLWVRLVALAKRNPWTTAAAAVTILAGLPGAVLGAGLFEPALPVLHYQLRYHVAQVTEPIIKTQNTQALSIDRFLLYRQEQDLKNLQADPALQTSPNLQKDKKELDEQIQDTKLRICKATGKQCP